MMKNVSIKQQHGLSLGSFLLAAVILILAAVGVMKLIPAYMQNAQIESIFDSIVQDPTLRSAPVRDIRMAYIKRAMVNDITAIKADEIEVEKDANGLMLSAAYTVKIPLAGNASLLLEFNIKSPK